MSSGVFEPRPRQGLLSHPEITFIYFQVVPASAAPSLAAYGEIAKGGSNQNIDKSFGDRQMALLR